MRHTHPLRVAELPYTNTVPFRLEGRWHPVPCPSPRLLGCWAEEGRIDAGLVSLVDGWRLEDRFDPVGAFGIACDGPARSVLLYSKRPPRRLAGAAVGLTDQSSTSTHLLKLLLEGHGVAAAFKPGFDDGDEARLLIGDGALSPPPALAKAFPFVMDLGAEWKKWKGLPFVFARWMVRREAPAFWRSALEEALESSLQRFLHHREQVCLQAARGLRLPLARVTEYLSGLTFRLGESEERGASLFRKLISSSPPTLTLPLEGGGPGRG